MFGGIADDTVLYIYHYIKTVEAISDFFTILTCTLLLIWAAYSSLNQSFKIPVAVQDQDQSQASHTLIQSIEKNDFVKVEKLDQEAIYLDESVSKKKRLQRCISLKITVIN